MPTEKELLIKTMEDLKGVPYKNWRYFNNGNIEGFAYTPSLMHVNVCHLVGRLDKEGFYLEVEDMENDQRKEYRGVQARNLYDHLPEQLITVSVIVPGFQKPAEATERESLLEKLMKEMEKK